MNMILKGTVTIIIFILFVSSSALYQKVEKKKGEIRFDQYFRYQEIQDYLNRLNVTYTKLVRVNNYGLSNENRNLTAIMISTGASYRKPLIFIDAGIHAREWISPAQALYIIDQLVENPNATKYIRNVDWLIVPLVNPDGYEYTHTADRFWRKNRAKGRICRGVDLNRNFDFQWSKAGASNDECSSTYAGPSAFSEPESLALSKLIAENSHRIKLYISLHSAAQSILYPWGYTDGLPNNGRELHNLAALVSDTVYKLNGTEYRVGTFANILYLGSGTSCDWAYSVANVKLAYTIELRPSNITYRSRFEIPTKNIFSIVTEMFEGLKTMHFYVEHKNVHYESFIRDVVWKDYVVRNTFTYYYYSTIANKTANESMGISFDHYLRYEEVLDYLGKVSSKYNVAKMEDFGVSYERRRLVLLKIVNFGRRIKPLIFIEAGIHAREWVAPAQALFIIHQLLEVPDNKELIEKVDWIVIPLVNPDGYEYSHSVDRMWRKNRAKGKTCDGVDLNRNFDFHWSQPGSSDYECSSTYAGVRAFSEPESLALSTVIKKYASRTKLYLSIHTAEQCILFPWGYTMEAAENDPELRQLASLVARKVYNISKVEYKVGTSAQTLNIVSGSSRDWAYGICNISLAFTIELEAHLNTRHCDRFIMPPKKINKVVSEMFEGIKVFYTFIKDKYCGH